MKPSKHRPFALPFGTLPLRLIFPSIPAFLLLNEDDFRTHSSVFSVKQFIGCGGLQVTEEKLIIAAVGCLLLLKEKFPNCVQFWFIQFIFVNEMTSTGNYVVEERRGKDWGIVDKWKWYYLWEK